VDPEPPGDLVVAPPRNKGQFDTPFPNFR
jgi:hypothetical protein